MKYTLQKILKEFNNQKLLSITQCTGPIPCISLEFKNCWIDLVVDPNFPVHQIVQKDKETVQARKKQLS